MTEKPQTNTIAKNETPKGGQTVEQVIRELAAENKQNPEKLLLAVEGEKLKRRLQTAEEVTKLKDELKAAILGDNLSDAYIGKMINGALQRKKAEDTMNALPGLKDTLGDVEKISDLRKLDAKTLIKLEDKYEGIMLYAFTDIASSSDKIDFAHWDGYKKITPGMKLTVNFLGSAAGEKEIGGADMLPPSVRRITVYHNGDLNDSRTSERRVGLKGQNKLGNGFYDGRGYISVLSGDVLEIGGKERSEKDLGVDPNFDQEFRKRPDGSMGPLDEEAYKKYQESDAAKQDQAYLQELFRKNPNAQRRKQMSMEEIQLLKEKIDGDGAGAKIAKLALEEAEKPQDEKYMPTCCWDLINHLYRGAGVSSKTRVYQDLNYEGKDCGDHHATPEMMAIIAPGDWVYYNNKNTADSHGNHSALILSYDKDTGVAQVASGYAGHPLRVHTVNLNENPVTQITKPGALARPKIEYDAENLPDVKIDESRSVVEQIQGLSESQRKYAGMIEEEFLAAGLSRSLAAAAIINAKAESGLNPGAVGDSGHSIGLFQLHDKGGGHGMSVEDRADARTNIQTILNREVLGRMGKSLRARADEGASVSELAAIFSRDIERPRDREGEMNKRARMAARLFRGGSSESQAA